MEVWGSTPPDCDGKLSVGLASSLGAAGSGTFETLQMPKAAARPLQSAPCCFPHASPVSRADAGKQEAAPTGSRKQLNSFRNFGAGEGIRTLDPNLGKVVLYP